MPIVVFAHRLKDFDAWIELFSANPPPPIGRWRLVRGIDDPSRVNVVGEMEASEVDDVKSFFASDKMRAVLAQADKLSTTPIETVWLEDITPD